MKKKNCIFLFILILILYSCATKAPPVRMPIKPLMKAPVTEQEEVQEKAESVPVSELLSEEKFITIVAAGDNLFQNSMIGTGEKGDYNSIYAEIKTVVQAADIAFINQETVLGGADFGFSGFPRFNTPQAVGQAIAAAGFNVVNHATNHIMDKGEKAVFATLDFWNKFPDVKVLGIHRSKESPPVLITRNDITVGFLSYTYGTNNIPLPADKPYLVSRINTETMEKEISALRPLCDFLVVSMHWGEEHQGSYSTNQERLAVFLAEHRVDLVIGHHPHVIQQIEFIPRPDGKSMLCFYSLGNFISAQTRNSTLLGALAYIRIRKSCPNQDGIPSITSISEAGAIPLISHYEKNYSGFKIYPLYTYSKELLEKHQHKQDLSLKYFENLSLKVLGGKEILYNPFSFGAVRN